MRALSELVQRPGADPRIWHSLAVVTAVYVDLHEATFVDVVLVPSEQEETARVDADYVGDQAGNHWPINIGDEVIVGVPMGAVNEGSVVLGRVWNGSTRPPMAAILYPTDVSETLPADIDRRFVSRGGAFKFCASDKPSDLNPSQQVIRGTNYLNAEQPMLTELAATLTALGVLQTAVGTFATAAGVAVPALAVPATTLNTAIVAFAAQLTAMLAKLGQFQAGFPAFLTPNVLVDDPGPLPELPP